jgi:ATP-dependent protease Clp ATPase subunit
LVKQYQKLFELDKVGLRSHERTLLKPSPIKAIARKTGARGLRNVH